MPLKDLTIDKSKATEDIIESIIKPYIRYDLNSISLFFLPESEKLTNIEKVLVYLVALKGWKFIAEKSISWEVKPFTIEKITGIKGGSLRPTLKNLKDRKIVSVCNGKYSIPDYNIITVKKLLEGETYLPKEPQINKSKSKKQKKSVKKMSTSKISKQDFEKLIESDWFKSKRTLNDIKEKFHEMGVIVPTTSLPYYLLNAIKEVKLVRKKEEIKGKKMWVYSKK